MPVELPRFGSILLWSCGGLVLMHSGLSSALTSRVGIEEGYMGEWNTVFEGEIEGHLVTVKVYQSTGEVDCEDDGGPAVRVTTTSFDDYPGIPEEEDGDTLLVEREGAGRLVTLEPYSLNDLEGELMEVGFSPAAAATIVSKVPV
ncbi:hypothetical protein [Microvirga arsenatis]|uniref:Lipocalin-like domain-containing protein n=1 Tax=Microvirga arsenatis TaxID=2692265 RepID=A0ABW9Z2R4_9HYPH|nr:hypothetical protein [Microvirga arsenatis]NBJ13480.1 hypothetical protein [Microvirga arsenatis]NBJ26982.1 hypothetical protein [Microvirga arsenatis]